MKRFVFIALVILLILVVALPVFAAKKMIIGIVTIPGSAQYICAEKFKELVESRSGGRFQFEIKHSASLGSESSIIQQVQMGTVDIAIITTGPVGNISKKANAIALPFIFKSNEEADRILDGPIGQEILDSLANAGIKGLAFSENGFRNLTNNVRPVHTVKDVKGLKIRTMEAPMHIKLWRLLGANPTPMPWPIYTELQQGTIDGQENPLWVIDKYKLYEVQKYMTMTRHVYSSHVDMMNLRKFNKLSKSDQALFLKSMHDAAVYQRRVNRENNAKYMANIKAHGMIVDEHPDIQSFRSKVTPIYEDAKRTIDRAFVEKLLNAVK